jgi:hypothetical protein
MIDRFIARVGRLGAILIVALAVVLIGVGGGAIEHFRLAASSEQQGGQQGEQQGEQGGSQAGSSQGGQSDVQSGQANEGQSQENDNASGARQPSQQSD